VSSPRGSLRRSVATLVLALVAAYCAQELLEGILASGHPAGLAGVFGDGGWTAIPLALPLALLVALGLRGRGALAAATADVINVQPAGARVVVLAIARARCALRGALRAHPARGPPLLQVS
jgi:hypothetical protein